MAAAHGEAAAEQPPPRLEQRTLFRFPFSVVICAIAMGAVASEVLNDWLLTPEQRHKHYQASAALSAGGSGLWAVIALACVVLVNVVTSRMAQHNLLSLFITGVLIALQVKYVRPAVERLPVLLEGDAAARGRAPASLRELRVLNATQLPLLVLCAVVQLYHYAHLVAEWGSASSGHHHGHHAVEQYDTKDPQAKKDD
eukprot:TRINITY_DN28971_c0_g1_i1.p1 TRINITY_DN28971_c0_g1~~TRINITY_DN28971_c0_g1_i1.p1  ORF type:complete len:225 (+),score=82.45 TRINITY_DN28971_c0_g1_i1:83-676(+)